MFRNSCIVLRPSSLLSSRFSILFSQKFLSKTRTDDFSTSSSETSSPECAFDGQEKLLFQWEEDNAKKVNNRISDDHYKFGELINCRIVDWSSKKSKKLMCVTNRMFKLVPGGVLRSKPLEIFHEHIREMRFFTFKNIRYDFKRPSLYEFIALKDQQAVSSHYSIIALVPMLLELTKGSRVLECGTGSGSMTLFLSEHIGNSGLLHTFDLTQSKQLNAARYFAEWQRSYDLRDGDNWPSNVRFGCMDFNKSSGELLLPRGYGNFYDAVYLDMAEVHVGLARAYELMRPGACLVLNCLHLTQAIKCLNTIERSGLPLEREVLIEPSNRFWETRRIVGHRSQDDSDKNAYDELNWVLRLEDRFVEKYKRGGLFFNYWQGFLIKFRKIK